MVAIYSLEPVIKLLVVRDADYARSQKQLFTQIGKEGLPPTLGFPYKPNHSFYNSLDFYIGGKQVIIWPDADAKNAFNRMSYYDLYQHLGEILDQYREFFGSATYIVGLIWSDGGDRMVDLWRFTANHVDDRSGPLIEVKVFRNQKECRDMGLASGITLMVLGFEEKLRRQSVSVPLLGKVRSQPHSTMAHLYL